MKKAVIARPVRTLVVAIPRLEGDCTEKYPEEWEFPRFLVVIVTWLLSTGGLPHQCAHWPRNDSKNSTNTNFSVCAGKPYEFGKISDNGLHPITYNYIIQGKAGIAYQKRSRRFRFRSPRSRAAGEVFAFLIAEMIFSKAFVPGILV